MDKRNEMMKISGTESPVEGFGKVHCANCDYVVAYFLSDFYLSSDGDLELYCFVCAEKMQKGEH